MPDPITQGIKITGDSSQGVAALRTANTALADTANRGQETARSVTAAGAGLARFFAGIAGTIKGAAATAVTSGGLAAKGLGGIGLVAGGVVGTLSKLNPVVTAVTTGLSLLVGTGAEMAGTTRTAQALSKTFLGLQSTLASPIAHVIIDSLAALNATLRDPAVVRFTGMLAALITVALRPVAAAVQQVLTGFRNLAAALDKGDIAGAVGAIGTAVTNAFDSLTGGAFSWGLNLITTFAAGLAQGAGAVLSNVLIGIGTTISSFLEGHSPPPKGPLSTIDRWGAILINTFLNGFRHADFTALTDIAGVIKTRLQTLVDRGDLKQINLIPSLLGSESAVASALKAMHEAGGLTDAILTRVRGQLAGLGPATQDYVSAALRALDATRGVETAQRAVKVATDALTGAQKDVAAKEAVVNALQREGELLRRRQVEREKELIPIQAALIAAQAAVADKEAVVNGLQREQEQLRRAQAARVAELIPLQDQLAALETQHNQLLTDQAPRRAQLRALTEAQAAAEARVLALQQQQAAALSALEPLRAAVTAATEAQYQAELGVQAAQDAMLPLAAALTAAQEGLNAAQAVAQAHADAYNQALDAARAKTEAATAAQQALLDATNQKYADQIALQQGIIDAVNAKWKAELDGANAALAAADRAAKFADRANRAQALQFARQRDAAATLANPNQRIAALARINRAEALYDNSVKARLARLQLEAQVAQDTADATKEKADAEKQGATDQIATLQGLLAAEQKIITDRMTAIKAEGDARLKQIQEQAAAQARADARGTAAAQAQVDAAQRQVAAAQAILTARQREAELAGRTVSAAQHELQLAEARVHSETDGAIAVAAARAQGIADAGAALQKQLDREEQVVTDRITATQRDLALRQAGIDSLAEKENRSIAARLQAAGDELQSAQDRAAVVQKEYDTRKTATDALTATETANVTARQQAAGDLVLAAQAQQDAAQKGLDSATASLTVAQGIVDQYTAAAQLAEDRVKAEADIAALRAQEAALLAAQAVAGATGGVGPGGPAIQPVISDPEKILAPWRAKLLAFQTDLQNLLSPIGAMVDDIFHGRFVSAGVDLEEFGARAGAAIKAVFGPEALAAVRAITDPLGRVAQAAFDIADRLQKGQPIMQAFQEGLKGIVPPVVATAIGDLARDLGHFADTLLPNLQKAWENLQPGIQAVGGILKDIAILAAGAVYLGLKLVLSLLQGGSDNLPSAARLLSQALGFVKDGLDKVVAAVGPVIAALSTNGLAGVFALLKSQLPDISGPLTAIQSGFQGLADHLPSVNSLLTGLQTGFNNVRTAVAPFVGPLLLIGSTIFNFVTTLATVNAIIATAGPILAGLTSGVGAVAAAFAGADTIIGGVGAVIALIASPIALAVAAFVLIQAAVIAWAGGIDGIIRRVHDFFAVLNGGGDFISAFQAALAGMIPPAVVAAVGGFFDGIGAIIGRFIDTLLPNLRLAWESLQPGFVAIGGIITDLLPVFGGIAAILGVVLGPALGIVLAAVGALLDGVSVTLPYIGTIFSGVFEIIGGVIHVFTSLLDAVITFVTDVFSGRVGAAMTDFQTKFNGVWTGIGEVVKGVVDVIGGLISGLFNLITTTVGDLVKNVTDFFTKLYNDLVGHSIVPDLVNGILGLFNILASGVVQFAKDIWDGVVRNVTSLKEDAINLFTTLRDGAVVIFTLLRDTAINAAKDLWTGIVGHIQSLKDDVISKVTLLRDGAVLLFNVLKDTAVGAAKDLWTGIVGHLTSLATDVTTTVTNIQTGAVGLFNTLRDTVIKTVLDLWTGAVLNFQGLLTAVTGPNGIIPTLVDGIIRVVGTILAAVTGPNGVIQNVITGITGEIGQLNAIGGNIVSGLVQGVVDSWHLIVDKIHELAANLPEPLQRALESHSPSEVMALEGDNVDTGVVAGVDRSLPLVVDAMFRLARVILDAVISWPDQIAAALLPLPGVFTAALAVVSAGFSALFGADVTDPDKNLGWLLFGHDPHSWIDRITAAAALAMDLFAGTGGPFIVALNHLAEYVAQNLTQLASDVRVGAMDVGTNLVQGFIDGIGSMLQALIDSAVGAVNAAIDAARSAANSAGGGTDPTAPTAPVTNHAIHFPGVPARAPAPAPGGAAPTAAPIPPARTYHVGTYNSYQAALGSRAADEELDSILVR